jgi:hypothetical protein
VSEWEFHHVQGHVVQIGKRIYNGPPVPTAADHIRTGHALLATRTYPEATRCFTAAITADPACTEGHFGLALALLQGVRPHRHGARTIHRVEDHLHAAAGLVEAHVLGLLVAEDHRLAWRTAPPDIPRDVMAIAEQLSTDRAELILTHVPAPEARTWRAIEQAAAR